MNIKTKKIFRVIKDLARTRQHEAVEALVSFTNEDYEKCFDDLDASMERFNEAGDEDNAEWAEWAMNEVDNLL